MKQMYTLAVIKPCQGAVNLGEVAVNLVRLQYTLGRNLEKKKILDKRSNYLYY